MPEEKHEQESRDVQVEKPPFIKKEVIKDDGRHLIFYTFPVIDSKEKK